MAYKQFNRNRPPVRFDGINTRNHPFVGIQWPVVGSKGDLYTVEMHEKGFTCLCTGFTIYGKCKHITSVIERILDENYPRFRY